jgi:murein DD-endopeptidase MepM/ murein hydrolase activator NlpD
LTKLYVGNLPFSATEDSVRALFATHGNVDKVALINDRDTGQPRGFGFVEMSSADAQKAMQSLNGQDFGGRPLKVNEAQDKPRGGGGGGGGGGGSMSGDYVAPTSGRVTSCYGARWGVTHYGVDIAAPIGTPIYAAHSGVVQRAGAATGFGQAVYIRGDDGAVTVYGHVNRYFVSLGERVSAGEEIAEVGNRGQSTGPHLHFEVHPGGLMYGGQVNPVPWLNARGVYLGGCGG